MNDFEIGSQQVTIGHSESRSFQTYTEGVMARYTHANHGRNFIMPFFHECMGDFASALMEKARKLGGNEVALELFDKDTGVCAYNHANKMVFVPHDVSKRANEVLHKMGILTSILVCVRSGFLWSLICDSGKFNKANQVRISELFQHMRKDHNAIIFIVGYDDDETLEDPVMRRFIHQNYLRVARADGGKGLANAITNAKYALGSDEIFSRTLYMDNVGQAVDDFESGFEIAAEAHAAPLISRFIGKCPKCNEPWYAPTGRR